MGRRCYTIGSVKLLFIKNFIWYFFLLGILAGGGFIAYQKLKPETALSRDTTTVTNADVAVIVTISGKVEAKSSARLNFPISGTVEQVLVRQGDFVNTGSILASLTQNSALADYNAALENLRYLEFVKDELHQGPNTEDREVTKTNVTIAEEALVRAEREYNQLVTNARRNYLSTGLEAAPVDKLNDDIPPIVTGNYLCDDEGQYTLSIFRSMSPTNYSYQLSGLESGTFTAFTDTPAALGMCGLSIQFDGTENYRAQNWTIAVPNRQHSAYLANRNAYELIVTQRDEAINAAGRTLQLARDTEASRNATPSTEVLNQADANIAQAKAVLATREALIADFTIRAPYDGLVTSANIKVGETASPDRTITIVHEGHYELKARIPEIDITKVSTGNPVEVVFDAEPSVRFPATVEFISPLSTEIEGVAYYEARIALQAEPNWIRAGLNADVHIIANQKKNIPTLPKRFIMREGGNNFVMIESGATVTKNQIETGLWGTNGLVEILSLPAGSIVALP